jgi:hypothetical protein
MPTSKAKKRPSRPRFGAAELNSARFRELESSSNQVLLLLDLFGRSLLDYRKFAQQQGYHVWGNGALGILGGMAADRLHSAVEQLREPLQRPESGR